MSEWGKVGLGRSCGLDGSFFGPLNRKKPLCCVYPGFLRFAAPFFSCSSLSCLLQGLGLALGLNASVCEQKREREGESTVIVQYSSAVWW